MTRILVAGGTGALGSAVVQALKPIGHPIRLLSRQPVPAGYASAVEWAQGDLTTGAGIAAALHQVHIIVNCAGDARNHQATDVDGVARLAEAAQAAGIRHFFHISIVGIDQLDSAFYRAKLEGEAAVVASGVPWSIQRVTQFHGLLAFLMTHLSASGSGYLLPIAGDARFQTIDVRDVAEYILPLFLAQPSGRLPDLGGPAILSVEEMARQYLEARGIQPQAFVSPNPAETLIFPSTAVAGFQQGFNTVPDRKRGRISWREFVQEQLASQPEPGALHAS